MHQLTLAGEVAASGGILVVDPKNNALRHTNSYKALINLSSESSETFQWICFRALGDYVDFNLYIDGKNPMRCKPDLTSRSGLSRFVRTH